MIYLVALLVWAGSLTGAFFYGIDTGKDRQIASQEKTRELAVEVKEAAQLGAAEAIAKLKPRNVTIKQEVQREIRTNTVYADCRHTDNGLRKLNEALTGIDADPASGGKLPTAKSAQ